MRMCDCWLIERAATPIASTGGAASSVGTTSSGSTAIVHGPRRPRLGLLERLDHREHPPPDRRVVDEAVTRRDPRPAREAGPAQQLRACGEPVVRQRAAGVPDRLEPVASHPASMATAQIAAWARLG